METDHNRLEGSKEEKKPKHILRMAVILAVLVCVAGGIRIILHTPDHPEKNTAEGTKILEEMDKTDVAAVNQKIRQLEEAEQDTDQAAEERSAREKFADCLVLGDSITQGLYEYGVLDQANVQADRGTGVSENSSEKLKEHIDRAKEMKPAVLFLAYGMNDIEAQNGDPAGFAKVYRPVLEELKRSM